ncbi:hypothetical protein HDU92_002653 [Lobulomyces angularis]|nr:hypothetical protein HDU92_002653 [Lobulomyces angularis]
MESNLVSVLFLVAGYGTRLERDLVNDGTKNNLLGLPKALLPLNEIPLLSHWMKLLQNPSIQSHLITNDKFYETFKNWSKMFEINENQLLNDKSTSNDDRLGAVADLELAVEKFNFISLQRDCLIIAGDTLFLKDFSLDQFLKIKNDVKGVLVTCVNVTDEDTNKMGIIEIDHKDTVKSNGKVCYRVTKLMEKPGPELTKSRLAVPCFYYLPWNCLKYLNIFMDEKKLLKEELKEFDASGKFFTWLVDKFPVYTLEISGRLDIGGLKSYCEADAYMKNASA